MVLFATATVGRLFQNPLHHQIAVMHLTAGIVWGVLFPARLLWRLGWGSVFVPFDAMLAGSVAYGLYGRVLLEIQLGYLWRRGNG